MSKMSIDNNEITFLFLQYLNQVRIVSRLRLNFTVNEYLRIQGFLNTIIVETHLLKNSQFLLLQDSLIITKGVKSGIVVAGFNQINDIVIYCQFDNKSSDDIDDLIEYLVS